MKTYPVASRACTLLTVLLLLNLTACDRPHISPNTAARQPSAAQPVAAPDSVVRPFVRPTHSPGGGKLPTGMILNQPIEPGDSSQQPRKPYV